MVKKTLKWSLIRGFLLAMLFVYISGELIGAAYRVFVVPFMESRLETQNVRVVSDGNIWNFLLLMLFYLAAAILPDGISDMVQQYIGMAMGESLRIRLDSPMFTGRFGWVYAFGMMALYFLLIFFSVLPYFIAAYLYYRMVSRKVEELLEEEKEQAKQFEQQKSLMLSDIAHDIKTPITTICGYSKALSDGLVSEERRKEYLDTIYAKSLRMGELVTLLFDYVMLDSAGFSLHKERGDVGELLRENTALLYTDFEEMGMEVEIDIPEESFVMEMDKVQMARAFTNLLTNVLRYGKKDGKLLVRLKNSTVVVADDGQEIEPEFAEHIFEPFARADKARSTTGGSGLGLSITSKIVAMHGGKLTLDCHYGEGYTKAFLIDFGMR